MAVCSVFIFEKSVFNIFSPWNVKPIDFSKQDEHTEADECESEFRVFGFMISIFLTLIWFWAAALFVFSLWKEKR